jgi:hypothetical protein
VTNEESAFESQVHPLRSNLVKKLYSTTCYVYSFLHIEKVKKNEKTLHTHTIIHKDMYILYIYLSFISLIFFFIMIRLVFIYIFKVQT